MQEEESHPYRKMQDRDSYGRHTNQEEECWKEGRALRLILFKQLDSHKKSNIYQFQPIDILCLLL